MPIELKRASRKDLKRVHMMQVESFASLLDKYQDLSTNPANETYEDIERRFQQENSVFFLIMYCGKSVGSICITHRNNQIRISPMFLLPDFQGKGYAQIAINHLENLYPEAIQWKLSTIKEEQKLRYFYEKIGYTLTGQEQKLKDGMTLVSYEKIKETRHA